MILIIGGSGVWGREVTKQLLARGEPVRLLCRVSARVEDLRQMGAQVIPGDLIDPASLQHACQDVDRVLAATHSLLGRGRYKSESVDGAGHRALIDAARRANVRHFVYTSIFGAAPDHPIDFFRTKYEIEQYLKSSGLSFTILRPSAFMEWHAHVFNGKSILESGKTQLLGLGTKPRNFIAVRDAAHFAFLALTDPQLQNRTINIGGPDNFTNNQVAELYGKLAGVTPKISHMPPGVAKAMSLMLKPFQPGIRRIMHMGSLPDDAFNERFDPAALLAEFPIRLTTLEEFVQERISERSSQHSERLKFIDSRSGG